MPNEIRLNPVIAIAAAHPTIRPTRVPRAQWRWRPSQPSAAIPARMPTTTSTVPPFISTSVAVVCPVWDVQWPAGVQLPVSLSTE